jgi:protein-S-isoprenylcysteine O-methyltransferase Ste14
MHAERLFRFILIGVFSAFSVIRILFYQLAKKAGCRTVIEESRKYSILLSVLICYEVFTFFIYVFFRGWLSWADVSMALWLRAAGAVLAFLALLLFLWVHLSLGHNFSVKLRIGDRQTMVTSGPYRRMRHPMYTAFYLLHLSAFFLTSNAFIGLTWTAGLTLIIALRVRREEAMMVGHFGDEYAAYMNKTGRFLPPLRVRGSSENGKDAA